MKMEYCLIFLVFFTLLWNNCTLSLGFTDCTDNPSSSIRRHLNDDIQLPTYVTPLHYRLFFDVSMTRKEVVGKATIDIRILQETRYIVVHYNGDKLIHSKLLNAENKVISQICQLRDTAKQKYLFGFQENILPGKYRLKFEFFYKLISRGYNGFYYVNYRTSSGINRTGAFTQFGSIDARRAFPCFDLPSLKATFDITIGNEHEYEAISNMPVIDSWFDMKSSKQYYKFARTPRMSTYTLAFAVCQYAKITMTTKTINRIKMTIYGPEDKMTQLNYTLQTASKLLSFFEQYLTISYSLPKLDMIVVPDTYIPGMENWGLITFSSTYILDDVTNPRMHFREILISHELAHQWFGNLLTMSWWDDVWLNEAFATYMSYIGVDTLYPGWGVKDHVILDSRERALKKDSMVDTRPIHVNVRSDSDMLGVFDWIIYEKGACVLRMLANVVMEIGDFNRGVTSYLIRHQYGNVRTEDLWGELGHVSSSVGDDFNISDIMNTWVLQSGFPVIDVRNVGDGVYSISQSRFFSQKHSNISKERYKSPHDYRWIVPFNYVTLDIRNHSPYVEKGMTKRLWLNMSGGKIITGSDDVLIMGNPGFYGYYRVNYDARGWQRIINILKENHLVFSVIDRTGLILDAAALSASGRLKYSTSLDLLDYIDRERHYLPWTAAIENFIVPIAKNFLSNSGTRETFKAFMRRKVTTIYKKYRFRNITDTWQRQLQEKLVQYACSCGVHECQQDAQDVFTRWMRGGNIPKQFEQEVLFYGVHIGGDREWQFVFERYLESGDEKLLRALCATKDTKLIERMLRYSFGKQTKKYHTRKIFGLVVGGASEDGKWRPLQFLMANWNLLRKRFKGYQFRDILQTFISSFQSEQNLKKIQSFLKRKGILTRYIYLSRLIISRLNELRSRKDWLNENDDAVWWLKSRYKENIH